MAHDTPPPAPRGFQRALAWIERAGNRLPEPAYLFLILSAVVIALSSALHHAGWSEVHPRTGAVLRPANLLSVEGLHGILLNATPAFVGFAPLGTVLVAMLGMGLAEASGLLSAALRALVLAAPRRLVTPALVLAGILSNTAGEIGYVLLIPLAALLFKALGRRPLLGLAAAFAGVSGGYSANLLLGTVDPLLAGLTQEAARMVDPAYTVNPAANYYFLAVSTVALTVLGTWVTERLLAPRLEGASWAAADSEAAPALTPLSPEERRGLRWAVIAIAAFALLLVAGSLPGSFLRSLKDGSLLHGPLFTALPVFILLGGLVAGLAYARGAGTLAGKGAALKSLNQSMAGMGSYIVLAFFASQFVAILNGSGMGLIAAIEGAGLLSASGLADLWGGVPILLLVVVASAFVNLMIGSASAKWAILAPALVPMLMLVGLSPETVQGAYRVGDSVTNPISPMMTYFPLILTYLQKHEPEAGLGTLMATMIPYSLAFFLGWSLLLSAWFLLDIPLGPGAPLRL